MGKNLPYEHLGVHLFAKNVIQITLYHARFADPDNAPSDPMASTIRSNLPYGEWHLSDTYLIDTYLLDMYRASRAVVRW
jgi:hypothetical protein